MFVLLGAAVTTSFFDSLNPSAIAQQMMLQAMVRQKRHIWFFISGIAAANLLLGLAVYYGVALRLSRLLGWLSARFPLPLALTALAAGAAAWFAVFRLLPSRSAQRRASACPKAPARLSPLFLFLLGAAFCGVELTSALPYFSFLALLGGYSPAWPAVLAFLALYDLIYILPLILIYFAYNRLRGTCAIRRLERVLERVSAWLMPVAVGLLGTVLIGYGIFAL